MNLFVSNFIQKKDLKSWQGYWYTEVGEEHICGSFCADTAGANSVLCHDPQCPLDYDVTSAHETSQLLFLKAAPVSIKDIWLIFCFSWAPQITRHIQKCAQCYASFLTFHLWAALSLLPAGQLKVISWELAGRPCAAADLSCHRSLRN